MRVSITRSTLQALGTIRNGHADAEGDTGATAKVARRTRRHRSLGPALIAWLLLSACIPTRAPEAPSTDRANRPRFEPTDCPTDPWVIGYLDDDSVVTCGYLIVPEDRRDPSGRTVRDFVQILEPPQGVTDPVAALNVGRDVGWAPFGHDYGGIADRMAIRLEPRGTGLSEPSLACPEVDALTAPGSDLVVGSREMRAAFLDAVTACHDRLTDDGIDLSAYNVGAMAADAEDLRVALGIDRWDVGSLGSASSIVFEMLRRYGEHIRSVTLDSPMPPGVDRFTLGIEGTEYAVRRIAAACAAEVKCHRTYPDVEHIWVRALEELDRHPSLIHDEDLRIRVDDGLAVRQLMDNIEEGIAHYDVRGWAVADLPLALRGLIASGWVNGGAAGAKVAWGTSPGYGNPTPINDVGYDYSFWGQLSHGVFYSTVCHDELPFLDPARLREAAGGRPWYVEAYVHNPFREVCRIWGAGEAATDPHAPVTSAVPTLVLVGALDPASPAPLVREGIDGLSAAELVVVPNWSHLVLGSAMNELAGGCGQEIRDSFNESSGYTVDASCLARMPAIAFTLPPPHTPASAHGPVISAYAGDGGGGSFGDGGPATRAQLGFVTDINVGPDGSVYVVEIDTRRVRRIDPLGRISTFIGTPTTQGAPTPPGRAGSIRLPDDGAHALTVGPDGALYLGMGRGGRNVILRVTPSGRVSRIAGTGEPGFSGDGGNALDAQVWHVGDLAFDDRGNLYFTDQLNRRVRMIDRSGTITTVAGTGEKASTGDGGAAIDASFRNPGHIAVTPDGTIYVSDFDRTRKIGRNGIITTVLHKAGAIAIGPDGAAYVASAAGSCVERLEAGGGVKRIAGSGIARSYGDGGPALAAGFEVPTAIAFGPAGTLYIGDGGRVRRIGP